MDKKKIQQSKSPRQGSSRLGDTEQQQLALAQLGLPPEFLDPNLMAYASGLIPAGLDPQQLLNPMAAATAYPFMNPAALQAFTGLGALGGQAGTGLPAGAADWWNMAQNQALAASLGAGFYPGMLPPGFPVDMGQKSKYPSTDTSAKSSKDSASNKKLSDSSQRASSPFSRSSQKPSSSGLNASDLQTDRKRSTDSQKSSTKDRLDSQHGLNSSLPTSQGKLSGLTSNSSWLDGLNGHQKINEQMMQAEMMRQLEQQFLLQQLQLQQQQHHQDQLTAALQSAMGAGGLPGSSSSSNKKSSSSSDKMQDQLSAVFQQLLQAGGASSSTGGLPEGISPAMAASLFSTPGAMEAMMAMTQMGNMNALSELGTSNASKLGESSKKSLPSAFNHSSSFGSSNEHKNTKSLLSPSSSQSKTHQSSSSQKSRTQQNDLAALSGFPMSFPGMGGTELSPDNAFLASLYSQQLQQQQQYEALIKQEMEAVNRLREQDKLTGESSKSKSHIKQESSSSDQQRSSESQRDFASPSAHNRSNLYSPANSTSSRGKAHTSPRQDSPSRKHRGQERSQSRGSGTSSSRHESPKRSHSQTPRQDNMSETLKLFSTLASNPNLTHQELAAVLSLPPGTDPALLLSSMSGMNPLGGFSFPPGAAGLLDAMQANSQMTPGELEKLNKDLASVLAYETQRLQEQLRQQQVQLESSLAKKDGEKDNHISVIHQNNLSEDRPSSSRVYGKLAKSELNELKNGDAVSSDGDAHSENSTEVSSIDRNSHSSYGRGIRKRRRVITNEDEVLEPLKHGWKREVRFKFIGSQLRGEVLYIAPTGKKFRTYPDVVKHLEENNITHLNRNNFSFSSRLRVGSFYEQKDKASRQWVKMTEEELDQRIQQLDGYRGQYQSLSPYTENSDQLSDKGDGRHAKREKEDQDRERQKEALKILRQQEKLQKLEQQRIEREIRERIAAEEMERQRMAEALERDQRRQQMLLIRALESRKRAEERERRREEIRVEKMMQREKKMEQRRIAMQIARELKMPVEDMSTIGGPELPDLSPLQGNFNNKCPHQLSGNATADLLMVLEFVKTFKECLRIQDDIIPSLHELQRGILNDPDHIAAMIQITMSLLHQCLCDPGVPAPGPWLHCLTGVKVTDIDVTEDNYSEILRLFIWARNNFKTEIAVHLESLPFPSLTADEKAQSLAFLVNELVCSRPICMEIEKNLDTLATLRRDKWMVEGQMRQLRVAHERNNSLALDPMIIKLEDDENSNSNSGSPKKPAGKPGENVKEEPQENTPESLFQKKMGELTQQHNSYNAQLANNSKPLRALDLGQDRYKRRYWVLPNLGGVYVEGLESGISYEDDEESPDESEEEEDEKTNTKAKVEAVKSEKEEKNGDNKEKEETEREDEVEKMDEQSDLSENIKTDQGVIAVKNCDKMELCDQSGTLKVVSDNNEATPNDRTEEENKSEKSSQMERTSHEREMQSDIPNPVTCTKDLVSETESTLIPSVIPQNDICKHYDPDTSISIGKSFLESSDTNTQSQQIGNLNVITSVGMLPTAISTISDQESSNEIGPTNSVIASHNTISSSATDNDTNSDVAVAHNFDSSKASDPKNSELVRSESPETKGLENSSMINSDNTQVKHKDFIINNLLQPVSETQSESDQSSSGPKVTAGSVGDLGKPELDMVSLATKGALKTLKEQDDSKETESVLVAAKAAADKAVADTDSVMVAAKAVAVKAVAASTHLLFGSYQAPMKKEPELSTEKPDKDVPTSNSEVSSLPFGTHTINALVEMGVNPTSLTSQQLEVLSHLEIPGNSLDKDLCPAAESGEMNTSLNREKKLDQSRKDPETVEDSNQANDVLKNTEDNVEMVKTKKKSFDQDAPMDLSVPAGFDKETGKSHSIFNKQPNEAAKSNVSSYSPSSQKLISVKQEPGTSSQVGSPFVPIRDSPDLKFLGGPGGDKFFIPISFPNNVSMDPAQHQYNKIISSCPSPNTLANFIVSSANYSHFPSLEDIKFPIRAPDVKEEPDTIPRDKKRGWWRIESEIELRGLCEKLHLRGIREKQLHRNITKNFDVCTSAMFDAVLPEHQFAVFTKEPEEQLEKTDQEKDKKDGHENSEEKNNKIEVVSPTFKAAEDLAFKSEMKVLHQVEELADRCCDMAVVSPQWRADNPKPSICRLDLIHVPLEALRDPLGIEIKFDITNPIKHDPRSALGAAVELIGCLERAVCRQYLKPPLVRKGGASEFSSLPSLSESGAMDVAAGLRTWRNAVASSSSASQLSLCVKMLENCIAWNRSANSPAKIDPSPNPKTKKRKAEKGTNAKSAPGSDSPGQPKKKRRRRPNFTKKTETVGADGKKAKRPRMPIDTADIISKSTNSGDDINESAGVMVNGDSTFDDGNSDHDLTASLSSPSGNFEDFHASLKAVEHNTLSPDYHTNSDNLSAEEYKPSAEAKKKKKKKKSKKNKPGTKGDEDKKSSKDKKRGEKDTALCKSLLRELQSHEAATWFLFPVDCKVVPGYRKVIKRPIDFHTIECRLKKGKYKTKDDFVSEVRLVFDNCQLFNEDDSNIGRAGHELRQFFERRWREIVAERSSKKASAPVPTSTATPEVAPVEMISLPDMELPLPAMELPEVSEPTPIPIPPILDVPMPEVPAFVEPAPEVPSEMDMIT